jgi:ABC-type antimicrobial peptide transport system permease subunit
MHETLVELGKVGEPLGIQAVDWQNAAGIIGQFIWVIRGVLTIAVLIIFAVAIVIINNSMVMATLERVAEIGTMRAIGAGKGFVTTMIIFETAVLGLIAGTVGALGGAAFIMWLGSAGIPAGNDFLLFLFSGPRLFPDVGVVNLVFTVLAWLLIDRVGRRPLLLYGLAGMGLCLALVAYGFGSATAASSPGLVLAGLLGFVASFAASLGPVMWVLLSEIFPNRVRALAISYVGLVNSTVCFLVQLLFPWQMERFGGAITFALYGVFAGLGWLLLFKVLKI